MVTAGPADGFGRILNLLTEAGPPNGAPISGASEAELSELSAKFGRAIPDDVIAWLRTCNGSLAAEGGIFSVDRMIEEFGFWEELRRQGWLPLAGDGCGNTYVVDTNASTSAVAFFEPIASDQEVQYYLASNLVHFLEQWLLQDAQERRLRDSADQNPDRVRWPFDRAAALQLDPALELFSPLPWDD